MTIPLLPNKGNLIIVSDIHGNLEDYNTYINLWDHTKPDNHIVFLGDLIHAYNKKDDSIKILDDAITKTEQYPNFHVLLGNHEWAHLTNTDIYKDGQNQRKQFEELVKQEKEETAYESMQQYIRFFKSLPLCLKTSNGLFLSHAGPSTRIKSFLGYTILDSLDYYTSCFYAYEYELLEAMVWNRPESDYTVGDVDTFLDNVGSEFMVVGHTPWEKYRLFGRQLIISSSFETVEKVYLSVDLSKPIRCEEDLLECLRVL